MIEPHLYHTLSWVVKNRKRAEIPWGICADLSTTVDCFALDRILTDRPILCSFTRVLSLETHPVDVNPSGDIDGQVATLNRFPLLEKLYLNPPSQCTRLPRMTALKSLHLTFALVNEVLFHPGSIDKQISALNILFQWLTIPTLRKVVVWNLLYQVKKPRQFSFKYELGSSSVTELYLHGFSNMWYYIVKDIVLSCRSLKSLIIDIGLLRGYRDTPSASGIEQAIQSHQESLQDLMIALSSEELENTAAFTINITIYSALKRLAIPERFLLPRGLHKTLHGLLPRSLCELQLEHDADFGDTDEFEMDAVVERYTILAREKAASLPSLYRVIWWFVIPDEFFSKLAEGELHSDDLQNLVDVFQDVGVLFEGGVASEFLATPLGRDLKIDSRNSVRTWYDNIYNCESPRPEKD